jgi:hypothetical protein
MKREKEERVGPKINDRQAAKSLNRTSYRVSSRVLASKAEVNSTPETEFGVLQLEGESTHIRPRGL